MDQYATSLLFRWLLSSISLFILIDICISFKLLHFWSQLLASEYSSSVRLITMILLTCCVAGNIVAISFMSIKSLFSAHLFLILSHLVVSESSGSYIDQYGNTVQRMANILNVIPICFCATCLLIFGCVLRRKLILGMYIYLHFFCYLKKLAVVGYNSLGPKGSSILGSALNRIMRMIVVCNTLYSFRVVGVLINIFGTHIPPVENIVYVNT